MQMTRQEPTQQELQKALEASKEALRKVRKNAVRRGREQMMRELGLIKVRGARGGVYWE